MSGGRVAACVLAVVAIAGMLAPIAAHAGDWRKNVTLLFSDRLRYESVDWFEPAPGDYADGAARYDYFGNQFRFGARITLPNVQLVVEGQDTRVLGLPDDATRAAAPGNLGPGATYYQYTPEISQGETFVKQAYATARFGGFNATLGRFEWGEGVETLPGDADLLWLKRARITERLIGPFGYTHVGRSLDGVRLWFDRPGWNVSALAVNPTAGGFEVSAGEEMDEVAILGLSAGTKRLPWSAPGDGRAFWFHFEDERVEDGRPVRVDNRALAARQADSTAIALDTFGGHAATVVDAGPGRIDAMLWAAWQGGEWGAQAHSAHAYAIEAGYQWPRWWGSPWLRAGVNVASGDGDASDGTHGTFVPLIPTPRIYALTPFYTAMNLDDRFVQLILKPHPQVTVRADYHDLDLAESRDLWYSGGGAIRSDLFGYGGLPSSGSSDLARLVDVGVTYVPIRQVSLYGYYGRVLGGEVIAGTFPWGENANYGYLEATYRW